MRALLGGQAGACVGVREYGGKRLGPGFESPVRRCALCAIRGGKGGGGGGGEMAVA